MFLATVCLSVIKQLLNSVFGYVVVQFCPWFKFYFLLFWGMVIYDNEFETRKNKILNKDKIEPQQLYPK